MGNDHHPFGMLLVGRNWDVGTYYRYGFQNQESDKNFLNGAVSFNFRFEDSRLGRFFSIDPLSNKFPFNSPYVFSENNVIAFRELEGLEKYYAADGSFLGKYGESNEIRIVKTEYLNNAINIINSGQHGFSDDLLNNILYNTGSKGVFLTPQEAALDWGTNFNGESIMQNLEFASTIYSLNIDGQIYFTYTDLNNDPEARLAAKSRPLKELKGTTFVGAIHSHAAFDIKFVYWGNDWNNEFSTYVPGPYYGDIEIYEEDNVNGYVSTPNGSLLIYDVDCDETIILSTDLPSDSTDPSRKNSIEPNFNNYNLLEE